MNFNTAHTIILEKTFYTPYRGALSRAASAWRKNPSIQNLERYIGIARNHVAASGYIATKAAIFVDFVKNHYDMWFMLRVNSEQNRVVNAQQLASAKKSARRYRALLDNTKDAVGLFGIAEKLAVKIAATYAMIGRSDYEFISDINKMRVYTEGFDFAAAHHAAKDCLAYLERELEALRLSTATLWGCEFTAPDTDVHKVMHLASDVEGALESNAVDIARTAMSSIVAIASSSESGSELAHVCAAALYALNSVHPLFILDRLRGLENGLASFQYDVEVDDQNLSQKFAVVKYDHREGVCVLKSLSRGFSRGIHAIPLIVKDAFTPSAHWKAVVARVV